MFTLRIMPQELAAAVAACAQFAEPNSKIPILKCLRIVVDAGFATFVATNTEQTIVIRAACEGDGSACIDAAAMQAKVSRLHGSEPVKFDGDASSITISHGRTKWKVPLMVDDEFPKQVADMARAEPVQLPATFLAELNRAAMATTANETRLGLRGVSMAGRSARATNGKKLAIIDAGADLPKAIIPLSAIGKLKVLGEGPINLACTENSASFFNEFVRVNTQLISETYPDLSRLIENAMKDAVNSAVVSSADIRTAIDRASAIKVNTEDAGAFIPLIMRFQQTEIELATYNREGEEGTDYVLAERDGVDSEVIVSAGYLLEMISSIDADRVRIRYGGNLHAVLITPEKSGIENVRLILPRRK